ncbi:transmembrane protein 104-like, partial [Polypterus senegalus]|uniref:transmembrane protein 104-like n=1 Tax=Polypterus senegalus TaxID=55291 RepID=UPI0019662851
MGQMASLFFNKVGVNLFYICLIVYLYGDLAIYAAAVPMSLMEVACGNHSCSAGSSFKHNDTEQCWGTVKRQDAYRIFLELLQSAKCEAPYWVNWERKCARGTVQRDDEPQELNEVPGAGHALCPTFPS